MIIGERIKKPNPWLLKREWKEKSDEFRIEAVIHDGQWYTVEKWAKVAFLDDTEKVEEYIKNNKDILYQNGESYRVDCQEVVSWYEKNNISLDEVFVPKNYPPRIWDSMTETESFLRAPRSYIDSLLLRVPDSELKDKITAIAAPWSNFRYGIDKRLYIYTFNAEFIRDKLQKELTDDELSTINIKIRKSFQRRDLLDMTDNYLTESLRFYLQYCYSILKPHWKTIDIFLPEEGDKQAQILEWVTYAMTKYDDTSNVPFAGYLSAVLQRWPYDLPDDFLGKDVSHYQRKRSRVVKELEKKYKTESIPFEKIEERLLDFYKKKEDIAEFERLHQRWLKLQGSSSMQWDVPVENNLLREDNNIAYHIMPEEKHNITKAILNATIKSEDYDLGIKLIAILNSGQIPNLSDDLSEDFKEKLKIELMKNEQD